MLKEELLRRKRRCYLNAALERGKLRDDYQDEETKEDPKHGRAVIKQLRDEYGISDRIPADAPAYEDVFKGLLADDPGGAILYEDHLDHITEMVAIAERETAERRASVSLVMEKLVENYYRPEVDLELRRSITGAFLEYHYAVELKCRKLSYIRTACMYYGVWLVKEIPVDRIVSEKIKEILGVETDCYSDRLPLSQIPGFVVARAPENPEAVSYETADEIRQGIREIEVYCLRHPHQVDVQCLMSVVTGTEELGRTYLKAAVLDEAIDRYSITDEARDMDRESWRALFDGWVMVRAFMKVAEGIMDFVREYQDKTVGAATERLNDILTDISYAYVEKSVRIALRLQILEGSMYEFSLGEATNTALLEKAAGKLKCVSLADAAPSIISGVKELIRSDKRIIPVTENVFSADNQKDLSFICLKQDKPCGLVLVSGYEEFLSLDLLYSTDNAAMPVLLWESFAAAKRIFGDDKKLVVPVLSDKSAKIVETIVPSAKRERLIRIQKK